MKSTNKFYVWLLVIIVIILGFVFTSTRSQTNSKEPIKIVAMFPLTGGLSSYGESAQRGAQMAIEEINQNGGVNGRILEVNYQDHKCDPKTALSIYKQFVSETKVFTSAACSGTVLAIAPNLGADKAILLGTITTTPKITGISPWVFRNWTSDAKEAELFAREIKSKGYKKVGVIYEETDYAKGLEISLENYLKDSGVEIVSESFATGVTDVRTQLSKIKSANVDVLFVSPQTVTAGEVILSQMETLDFKPKLIVNDNILKSQELMSKHKDILNGAIGADYVIPSSDKLDKFAEEFRTKYGNDCKQLNICAGVYDAIKMLATGIAQNGYDAKSVQKYLQTTTYQGLTGQISFDQNNDRRNSDYTLFEIKDGKVKQAD